MLKKITAAIFCIICAGIAAAATASAAASRYVVNGTDAHTNNFSAIGAGYEDTAELPGALTIKTTSAQYAVGKTPEVTYSFTVDKAGSYNLSLEASQHSYPLYFSPYSISVNGGEYISINETNAGSPAAQLSDFVYSYGTNLIFTLNKGTNTVKFRLDSVRGSDNRAYAYLQRIIFSGLDMLISDKAVYNVFEQGQEIIFETGIENTAYKITGYSGDTAASGTSELLNGKWVIRPGKLGCGHYMIETLGIKEYFSVVKPLAEHRDSSASPFAADCASTFIIDEEDISGFAETVKLAGIQWIRDRIRWGDISKASGSYDFSLYDKYIDAFASRGIHITETFHSAPAYTRNSGSVLPDDLIEAYSFAKTAGARYDGRVDAWEIWNEPDISFTGSNEPADKYAAVLKAMSLGFRDGSPNTLISTAGMANVPGEYNDLLLSNDVNNFFDIYNFHAHRSGDSSRSVWAYPMNVTAHNAFMSAYSLYRKPVWTGEAGVFMEVDDGDDLSWQQQKLAARYLVTSSVEGLANGEDKHFWFILPYYMENGMSLGSFSSRGTPYAAYSAAAALTDSIGNGEYYGKIAQNGINAYCFKDGDEYVAVLWSGTTRNVNLKVSGSGAVVTDIMGNSTVQSVSGGAVGMSVGADPVYVRAAGFPDAKKATNGITKEERGDLPGAAERIVIRQKYPASVSENAKTDGYSLPADGKTAVTAEVYNFNSFAVTAEIKTNTYGGWKVESGDRRISVPAMSKQTYTFYISSDGTPSADAKYPVVISGSTSYGSLCRSTAYITSADDTPPVIKESINNFSNPAMWADAMPYGTICTKERSGSGISFGIKFNESTGDKWCYPQLNFRAVQDFSNYNGISVSVTADKAAAGSTFRMFLVESDGAMYFTSVGYTLKEGTQTFKLPWSRFVWQGGTVDTALNTDEISAVKAGINTDTTEALSITINSMGLYGDNAEIQGSIGEPISADGWVSAQLGSSVVPYTSEGAAVIINGTEYPAELRGGMIKCKLFPKAGEYTALLRVYNESGYAARRWFTLKADGGFGTAAEGFYNSDGTVAEAISGGSVIYRAVLENGTESDEIVLVTAAGYDRNSVLLAAKTEYYDVEAGDIADVELQYDADGAEKIVVYKWIDNVQRPIESAAVIRR